MIDHLTLTVRDIKKSRAFYERVLETLGYRQQMEWQGSYGYGDKKPDFWMKQGEPQRPMHIAFRAKTRAQVDAFHVAAIAAGAKDDGKPGPRPHYHENYYGAFVIDPDGHPIEAVCHQAE